MKKRSNSSNASWNSACYLSSILYYTVDQKVNQHIMEICRLAKVLRIEICRVAEV